MYAIVCYSGCRYIYRCFLLALLPNLVKYAEGEAVNEPVQWCSNEIQRPYEPIDSDGLFQSRFGETAELLQPRLDQRPEAFDLVGVDAALGDVFSY